MALNKDSELFRSFRQDMCIVNFDNRAENEATLFIENDYT